MLDVDSLHPCIRDLPVIDLSGEPEGLGFVFRPIPWGAYTIGSRSGAASEQPRVDVQLDPVAGVGDKDKRPAFWLADAPVTQAQFRAWTETDAYRDWVSEIERSESGHGSHANHFNGDELPVERVTWFEARAYCRWLEERLGARLESRSRELGILVSLHPGLPSEAAWEIACRAAPPLRPMGEPGASSLASPWGRSAPTDYWSGDGEGALDSCGWFHSNSNGGTRDVRTKPASPWGLYDMHGNVWEWCLDRWDKSAYRAAPPMGLAFERGKMDLEDRRASRVVRGGSWGDSAWGCRSAFRSGWGPGNRNGVQGFRVALLPGSVVPQAERGAPQATRAEAPEDGDGGGGTPPREPSPGAGAARPEDPFTGLRLPSRPPGDSRFP